MNTIYVFCEYKLHTINLILKYCIKNSKKMIFKDYYQALPDQSPKVLLRDKLLRALGMKYSTFYQKMNAGTFTKLEREKIAQILETPVIDLFPEYSIEKIS